MSTYPLSTTPPVVGRSLSFQTVLHTLFGTSSFSENQSHAPVACPNIGWSLCWTQYEAPKVQREKLSSQKVLCGTRRRLWIKCIFLIFEQGRGQQTFFCIRGQIVNIWGSTSHSNSVEMTELCCCKAKAVIDNGKGMNTALFIQIKLYLYTLKCDFHLIFERQKYSSSFDFL